jgi:hypothetical protein
MSVAEVVVDCSTRHKVTPTSSHKRPEATQWEERKLTESILYLRSCMTQSMDRAAHAKMLKSDTQSNSIWVIRNLSFSNANKIVDRSICVALTP